MRDGNTTFVNKQIMGTGLTIFNLETNGDYTNFFWYMYRLNQDAKVNSIKNMYYVPERAIMNFRRELHTAYCWFQGVKETIEWWTLLDGSNTPPQNLNINVTKLYSGFYDYTPKNNKCYCYPYNYLYITNNSGNNNIYKYEDFQNTTNCIFEMTVLLNLGVSGKLTPIQHKRIQHDDDNAIPLGKYPTASWISDAFTNWLTQQAINIPSNVISMLSTIPTYFINPTAGAFNTASAVAGLFGNYNRAKLLPNTASGSNTADVTWATNHNKIMIYKMRAKTENIKVIDQYFSRFGYKINETKLPNITGRSTWNYVEIGENEVIGYGEIPNKYLEIINNIFKKGVTIWHDHSSIGEYNLPNNIV